MRLATVCHSSIHPLFTERIADWGSIPTPIMTRDLIFLSLSILSEGYTTFQSQRYEEVAEPECNFALYSRISECLTIEVFPPSLVRLDTHLPVQ
jgi:hypothetical protein